MNFRRKVNGRLLAAVAGLLFTHATLAAGLGVIKGDAAKAQQTVNQVCAACHAADGNSAIPANPSLAGQHPEYTYKQLMNFKSQGGKPPERQNPIMAGMVAALSEDDMKNIAAYFAQQKPAEPVARNAALIKQGEAIYRGGILSKSVPACAGCHLPNSAGIPAQFPRLAGQHAEYTIAQLKAFRAGQRANDPAHMMRGAVARMSDDDIAAVAEYISGLR